MTEIRFEDYIGIICKLLIARCGWLRGHEVKDSDEFGECSEVFCDCVRKFDTARGLMFMTLLHVALRHRISNIIAKRKVRSSVRYVDMREYRQVASRPDNPAFIDAHVALSGLCCRDRDVLENFMYSTGRGGGAEYGRANGIGRCRVRQLRIRALKRARAILESA